MAVPPVSSTMVKAFSAPSDAWNVVDGMSSNASDMFEQMAQIEGLLGGKSPYNDAELRKGGHAEMLNLNFRSARMRVRRTFRRFLDLLISTPQAVTVRFKEWGEPSTRSEAEAKLAECLTAVLRSREVMRTRRQRLRDMVRVGAGFAYFPDKTKPVPRFLARASVLLPMDARENPADWSVCAIHDELTPADVLRLIDAARAGSGNGWNLRGLQIAAYRAMNEDPLSDERAFNVEKAVATENKLRLNSTGSSFDQRNARIPISRVYARNSDGTVDMHIIERRNGTSEWLCQQFDVAKCFSHLLFPLYYQEDENLYWNIEGLGQDIYNAEMLKDQTLNATADATNLAMRPVVTHATGGKSATAVQVDRFVHVQQGEAVSFDAMRGDFLGAPLLLNRQLESDLESKASGVGPRTSEASLQPVSAAEAKVENIEFNEQHTVAADFLYEQEEGLAEEVCNRLLAYEKSEIDPDKEGEAFREKIRKYDYFQAKYFKADNVEIKLYRAIGAGNGRDRRNALGLIFQSRGALDPIGQKEITFDFVSELAGLDYAKKYVRKGDERQTPTTNGQHAHLENAVFQNGTPLPTPVDDNHGIHAPIHLQFLLEVVKAGMQAEEQQARFDSQRMLATFNAALPHTAQHIDFFVAGANTGELKAQGDQFVSALAQVTNYMQRIQKRVKDEQIAQAEEAQRQQVAVMQERAGIQEKMQTLQLEIDRLRADTSVKQQRSAAEIRIAEQDAQHRRDLAEREAERRMNTPTR